MESKSEYTHAEWDAWRAGEKLAEAGRPFRARPSLPICEQAAFRDGYDTKDAELRNRPVVEDIKRMLGGDPIVKLFRAWVRHEAARPFRLRATGTTPREQHGGATIVGLTKPSPRLPRRGLHPAVQPVVSPKRSPIYRRKEVL